MISPLKTSGPEGLAGGRAGFDAAAGATGPAVPSHRPRRISASPGLPLGVGH